MPDCMPVKCTPDVEEQGQRRLEIIARKRPKQRYADRRVRVAAEVIEQEVTPPPGPGGDTEAENARPSRGPSGQRDGPPGQQRAGDAVARALVVVPAVDEFEEQVEIGRHGGGDRHRDMTQARQVRAVTRREQVNGEPGESVTDRRWQAQAPSKQKARGL